MHADLAAPDPPPPPSTTTHYHSNTARIATGKGHIAAEHATVADSYDAWKMASGNRRLGERVDPGTMATLSGYMVQDAIRAAAGAGGDAGHATLVGREAGVMPSVATHLDTEFHLAQGEAPEGPLTRPAEEAARPPWEMRP